VKACELGYINIAMWLQLPKHADFWYCNRSALQLACENGHLELAQWLHELHPNSCNWTHDCTFMQACCRGHLEVAQWLYTLGVNIDLSNSKIFKYIRESGRREVFNWLLSLSDDSEPDDFM
jgi:hypothetical protein